MTDRVEIGGAILVANPKAIKLSRDLADRVKRSLSVPSGGSPDGYDVAAAQELSARLLPERVRKGALAAKRIVVVPDGPLTEIPFDVLLQNSGGQSGENPAICGETVYSNSATMYINRREARRRQSEQGPGKKESTAVILGDPIFSRPDPSQTGGSSRSVEERVWKVSALDQVRLFGGALRDLPGTRQEIQAIARLFADAGGPATVLAGDEATIGRLEAEIEGKRFIHLATHGLTGSRDRPYDACLALTRPEIPMPEDIGFLTLDHLIRKWRGKLKDCELVVLSACDTQHGVKIGGSVMALPWGFMYAGAPTVIASLWKVDDTAAALLMMRFYENLLGQHEESRRGIAAGQRMPKGEALCEAKIWLKNLTCEEILEQIDKLPEGVNRGAIRERISTAEGADLAYHPYAAPYFWAAFILIGDPE
jgi:CHAT domain-containing protein